MKILSRLMALLCVMGLFACGAAAEVMPLAETLDSYTLTADAASEACNEQFKANELYEELLVCSSIDEMYAMVFTSEHYGLLEYMSNEQLQNLSTHAYFIYNEETDDVEYLEMLCDAFIMAMDEIWVESAYGLLATASCMEEMWQMMSAEENIDGVHALSIEEIEALRENVFGFYNRTMFPTNSEMSAYHSILELLSRVYAEKQVETYATSSANWGGTITTSEIKSGDTLNVTLTGDVILSKYVYVYGTLNITTDDKASYTITRNGNYNNFFYIGTNGRLTINGTESHSVTLANGNSGYPTIQANGRLDLNHVIIKNCENNGGSWGGAIEFTSSNTKTNTIQNTTIDGCKARNGSAIMLRDSFGGTVNLSNSTIKNCVATRVNAGNDYAGTIRTQGGTNCKLNITSCIIENNSSSVNGGGVYWNARGSNAGLTIGGTVDKPTIIRGNYSPNGGGVFLSGSSITIENTEISGNTATFGAGICMQGYDFLGVASGPGCMLVLNSGAKVLNNVASSIGGGVYMQIDGGSTTAGEDFIVTVNTGAIIQGNKAENGGGIAITQKTGNATYTGGANRKYDAFVNIEGGTISGNEALVNGGALYINREYGNDTTRELDVKISGGEIFGNKANGNGGACYIADQAANSKAKVDISGSTTVIGGDSANTAVNGGAIYVNNGNVTMSGGTVQSNTASTDGGAVYVTGGSFTMTGGTMQSNRATAKGGAVRVNGGNFSMSTGTLSGNNAANGGAAYVSNGKFIMTSGTLSGNTASTNGGAAYVEGGEFQMTNGVLSGNTATGNGGAAYVTKTGSTAAKFDMTSGEIVNNTAGNGGAVYVDGGDFVMKSGKLNGNTALKGTDKGYGGAAYANNGNIIIGLVNCKPDSAPVYPHTKESGHPIVQENKATFGGAFAIHGGTVTLYCCDITLNEAANDGCGQNIFMYADNPESGGELIHYYEGATIGTEGNHGVVSIGGKLTVKDYITGAATITIKYDPNNDSVDASWEGVVPEGYSINLPFCPDEWVGANESFVGWTKEQTLSNVRRKDDYLHFGRSIALDPDLEEYKGYIKEVDGKYTITFYAVYAPKVNEIKYAYTLNGADGEETEYSSHEPKTYICELTNTDIEIPQIDMPGYAFYGWRLEASTETKSNWNSDVSSVTGCSTYMLADGSGTDKAGNSWSYEGTTLKITSESNFGEIKMVAIFKPAFSGLEIKVENSSSLDANESYYFMVEGNPSDDLKADFVMYVSVIPKEDGTGSATIYNIPVGDYTITELGDWSWRYSSTVGDPVINDFTNKLKMKSSRSGSSNTSKTVNIPTIDQGKTVTFTVERNNPNWLDDNANKSYQN